MKKYVLLGGIAGGENISKLLSSSPAIGDFIRNNGRNTAN